MDTFLEIPKLLKMTQEEVENLNKTLFSKEIDLVTKNLQWRKSQDQWLHW